MAATPGDMDDMSSDAGHIAEEAAGGAPRTESTPPASAPSAKKDWYVLRVQVGREDTIKENIERRVKIEGLDDKFGQIYIPVEQYTERRGERARKSSSRSVSFIPAT